LNQLNCSYTAKRLQLLSTLYNIVDTSKRKRKIAKRTRKAGTAKGKREAKDYPASIALIISQDWVRAQGLRLIKPGTP
jgi:hypothetical protein